MGNPSNKYPCYSNILHPTHSPKAQPVENLVSISSTLTASRDNMGETGGERREKAQKPTAEEQGAKQDADQPMEYANNKKMP